MHVRSLALPDQSFFFTGTTGGASEVNDLKKWAVDHELTHVTNILKPGMDKPKRYEIPEGAVIAPRKGEEDNYFVAGAGKKKNAKGKKNKGTKLSLNDEDATSSPSTPGGSLHVPFGMLSALLALSIPPPMNQADLSRVVDNVKLKREYFLSNQARATKENMEQAEKQIAERQTKRMNTSPSEA